MRGIKWVTTVVITRRNKRFKFKNLRKAPEIVILRQDEVGPNN